jgi:hypothetical protein
LEDAANRLSLVCERAADVSGRAKLKSDGRQNDCDVVGCAQMDGLKTGCKGPIGWNRDGRAGQANLRCGGQEYETGKEQESRKPG